MTKRYGYFTVVVALVSFVGFANADAQEPWDQIKAFVFLNLAPHLFYLFLFFMLKFQLKFIEKSKSLYSMYKPMVQFFSWLFIAIGSAIAVMNAVYAITNVNIVHLEKVSMGLALLLAGYDLIQFIKTTK